jgi:hypothetical protein
MICASVCLLLPISSSPESENHTQFCADPGGQVSVMAFITEQPQNIQNIREAMHTLSEALLSVEATLTAYMQHGPSDRRELTPERQALVGDLERYAKMSNELAMKLSANR